MVRFVLEFQQQLLKGSHLLVGLFDEGRQHLGDQVIVCAIVAHWAIS